MGLLCEWTGTWTPTATATCRPTASAEFKQVRIRHVRIRQIERTSRAVSSVMTARIDATPPVVTPLANAKVLAAIAPADANVLVPSEKTPTTKKPKPIADVVVAPSPSMSPSPAALCTNPKSPEQAIVARLMKEQQSKMMRGRVACAAPAPPPPIPPVASAPPPASLASARAGATTTTTPKSSAWWTTDPALRALTDRGEGERLDVVWVKLKGYPWWPAQMVPTAHHDRVPPGCKKPAGDATRAYQFFGTSEYQWIDAGKKPNAVVVEGWALGWQHGHWAVSKRKGIMSAIEAACAFVKDPTARPVGWYDYVAPPTPPPSPPPPKAPKAPKKRTASTPKKAPPAKKQKQKPPPPAKIEKPPTPAKKEKPPTKKELRAIAKAEAEAAKQAALDAMPKVKYPKLTALTAYPTSADFAAAVKSTLGVDEFKLPFEVRALGKPPTFEMLRRCQWICQAPPRLIPKEEAEPCMCVASPAAQVAMAIQRDAERAEKAAKKEAAAEKAAAEAEGRDAAAGAATAPAPANAATEPKTPAAAVPRLGCGEECFNRTCHTTCDPRVCPCGPSCSNRPFHLLSIPKNKIMLTEHRGWGLFAAENVPKGRFIVEYTGEIIDEKTCEERLWEDKKRGEDNFYLMEVGPHQVIDARLKGNLSRFINSSCHPNCETQKWQDASTGETRVGIFAIEDIPEGTEFTYDYNFAHFGGEGTTSFQCMCGHPLCRGTLDANPERTRNYGRRIEIAWDAPDGGKTFYPGVVLSYTNTTMKYKVLYDSGEVESVKLEGANAPEHRWLSPPTTAQPEKKTAVAEVATKGKKNGKKGGSKKAAAGAGGKTSEPLKVAAGGVEKKEKKAPGTPKKEAPKTAAEFVAAAEAAANRAQAALAAVTCEEKVKLILEDARKPSATTTVGRFLKTAERLKIKAEQMVAKEKAA